MACIFNRAWIGECGKECEGEYCADHESKVCVSCGGKATRECPEASSLVCGYHLCDDCMHEPYNVAGFCYGKDRKHGRRMKFQ
jgi:hypothetical protein